MSIVYEDESYAIRGAVFEVYREMGFGFLEGVYQECMERELQAQGIPFARNVSLSLCYKASPLLHTYRADLVCYDKIIVELKAVRELCNEHRAQLLNYLRASGFRLGLLVNFGHCPKAQIERICL